MALSNGGDPLKELLVHLAKALVDKPDEVEVMTTTEEDGTIIYQLKVASDDIGKVIGKKGRIANALRVIIGASATKEGKVARVQILD
ncbi:KH domain-containing protein [Candidatus Hakubella thermalkaliphila]|uniref:RNA-binding protein KhpA n=1 Tax=Candidatus Hakubella thermalkaliphila TaxID=2754717 RepID=A0A6V8Q7E5_9ACTN|nr:KH domain-containing protein [Candidatus Hakubella thermalkaliphila]GFP29820.1 uncharacterized protein HKBW3S34_00741 [Candidatus Hakubella thermalkaliphila]GFP38831.1 uncharacterized protein HKBW3S47_00531 [Candidatus Hakubella thermalkaliphila]GFP42214.1 uncharacterized protein HKBW3C_01340 [Candidatus Hakubella thermalkaliphila]